MACGGDRGKARAGALLIKWRGYGKASAGALRLEQAASAIELWTFLWCERGRGEGAMMGEGGRRRGGGET